MYSKVTISVRRVYVEIFRRTTSRLARASFDRGSRIITSWFPSITTITVDEARRSRQHVYAIIRTIRRGLKLRCPEATLDPDWKLRTPVDVYARSSPTCYLDLTTRLRRVLKSAGNFHIDVSRVFSPLPTIPTFLGKRVETWKKGNQARLYSTLRVRNPCVGEIKIPRI